MEIARAGDVWMKWNTHLDEFELFVPDNGRDGTLDGLAFRSPLGAWTVVIGAQPKITHWLTEPDAVCMLWNLATGGTKW